MEASIDPHSCGFVVGSAGTVGTGAIDDLPGLADLCAHRPSELWFHVDGAIGAVVRCSTRLRPLFAGFERADSLAFDLHKLLSVPYECGCVLIRNGQLHRSTFVQPAVSYLTPMDGGIAPSQGEYFFSDYGLEMSRNTKAIKVWMTLKTYGIERFGRIMEQIVDQAKYFADLVQQHPNEFELLAKVTLNVVCFRYVVPFFEQARFEDVESVQQTTVSGHTRTWNSRDLTLCNGWRYICTENVYYESSNKTI